MTEREWLEATHLYPALHSPELVWSGRKKKLFCIACVRRVLHLMDDPRSRLVVEIAQKNVEGLGDTAELKSAARDAEKALDAGLPGSPTAAAYAALHLANVCQLSDLPSVSVGVNVFACVQAMELADKASGEANETRQQAQLLREIVGNPFRPVAVNPMWLTSNVLGLAKAMHESLDFTRMSSLADALLASGCDNDEILGHCRESGMHVRGAGSWICCSARARGEVNDTHPRTYALTVRSYIQLLIDRIWRRAAWPKLAAIPFKQERRD